MAFNIAGKLFRLIASVDAEQFDRWEPKHLEEKLEHILDEGTVPIKLKGVIDRVSVSEDGDIHIIDYKTSYTKPFDQIRVNEGNELQDFQAAMYVLLYELRYEKKHGQVNGMSFLSINKVKVKQVFYDPREDEKAKFTRKDFQPTLDQALEKITSMGDALSRLDWTQVKPEYKTCAACDYRTICRRNYALDRSVAS
jgi:RecB family exonuclease